MAHVERIADDSVQAGALVTTPHAIKVIGNLTPVTPVTPLKGQVSDHISSLRRARQRSLGGFTGDSPRLRHSLLHNAHHALHIHFGNMVLHHTNFVTKLCIME